MRRIFSFATVALLALSATASAQRGHPASTSYAGQNPIELGADAALSIGMGAPAGSSNVTFFDIPVSQVRVGWFVSPELSIEPSLGMHYASANGGSATHYDLGLGALYHFSTIRTASQVYVRPFLNYTSESLSGTGSTTVSASSVAFGAGLGIKVPAADRFMWRFEGNIAHNNNNNFDNSPNRIGLLAGVSYFTH